MSEVNEYMDYKKLPHLLRARITDYFENRYRGHYFDEDKILSQLSEVLRADLLHHNCHSLIKKVSVKQTFHFECVQEGNSNERVHPNDVKVPFFKHADPYFVYDLIRRLRSEFYLPGDTIIKAGTIGDRMFFLQNGDVVVVLESGAMVAHLRDGAYFGGESYSCGRISIYNN